MGGGRQEPEDEAAELRQIEALNRERTAPDSAACRRADKARAPREPGGAGPGDGRADGQDGRQREGGPERDGPEAAGPGRKNPGRGGGPGRGRRREGPYPGALRYRDDLLLRVGHALAEADSLEGVLEAVSRLHAPGFPLNGQVVFGVSGTFLTALGRHGFRGRGGADGSFRMPMSTGYPAVEVVRTGAPVFLSSPQEYQARFRGSYPLSARKGRRAWAYLPLATGSTVTAVWLAAFEQPVAFTSEERSLLAETARLISRALDRTRTGEAELSLSRGLRRSMGRAGPSFAGMNVAARYVPTGGGLLVGGDWFDSIELPTGKLALVIGDVQGHDVHAAGLMTQLRTAVHAYAAEGHGPDAVLSRASRFLTALDNERFATCLYVEADPVTGRLQIARAGHPHPVLRLPDGTCMIKHVRGGLPLGLMNGEEDYPVTTVTLHDGEVLLLCTDGLIESGGHDMYSGWVRVREALTPGPADDLEAIADRLIDAMGEPPPDHGDGARSSHNEDDIALLLVRRDRQYRPPGQPERRLVLTIEQDRAEGLAEARAELRALLHDWSRPDQIDTAVLLASEVVGNVLLHTDQTATLVATVNGMVGDRVLRVEVTDRGDELPHQRAPGELASSGRGLVLLEGLADRWGVRPEPEGKTVWFVVAEADSWEEAEPEPGAGPGPEGPDLGPGAVPAVD